MGRIRTGDVRKAADTVAGVAAVVRNHVPSEVGGIAAALTGSASGTAGTTLAGAWAESYAAWATQAEQHAQSMREAAAAWDAVDTHAAGTYNQFPMTPMAPPAVWPGPPFAMPPAAPTPGPTNMHRFVAGGTEAV